jgi:hypothetical protein
MGRFFAIRVRLLLRQLRWGLIGIAAWIAFGVSGFLLHEGHPWRQAVAEALYLGSPDGGFWELYSFWGQCVLFGVLISVFLFQALQRYNPQEGCRMLAQQMRGHTVVIGYSHLGARVVDKLRAEKRPYVLIEKDASAVDDLVRRGDPVIVDNAKDAGTLEAAGVAHAEIVVVASNNIETALMVTKKARERNRTARIVVRCYQDEFAEILEGLGADEVISSSKSAFNELAPFLPGGAAGR